MKFHVRQVSALSFSLSLLSIPLEDGPIYLQVHIYLSPRDNINSTIKRKKGASFETPSRCSQGQVRKKMDPHSRRAQYNQRPPKVGPELQNLRHGFNMEMKTLSVLDAFRKTGGSGSEVSSSPVSRTPSSSSSSFGVTRKGVAGKDGIGKGKGKGREKDLCLYGAGSGRVRVKSPVVEERPIATNARVRRDEKYKRDMYLAFVDNALVQKAQVCTEKNI